MYCTNKLFTVEVKNIEHPNPIHKCYHDFYFYLIKINLNLKNLNLKTPVWHFNPNSSKIRFFLFLQAEFLAILA